MKIAVEGCCHGELDKIYDTVTQLERQNGFKIDVLIICGDFQSVRNTDDLQAMAVPPKYQKLNTFYKYYSGEKVAPVLTIFVGGNHEASNYLQELPYGGWVARNIYYLGYAGIIQVGGVRIGGISGIYKGNDYNKGHYEYPPYDEGSKRSVYHVRNLEVFRLKQVTRPVDIFVSHDWPTGIYNYGDADGLVRIKPFFKKEVEEGTLGSKPCADLLNHLKPSYWFAAHLHVKFAAFVQHMHGDGGEERATKFLALDKCLPRRKFLQVLDVPHQDEEGLKIKLDPEWLRIVQSTNHLLNTTSMNRFMPGPGGNVRFDFTVSDKDMESVSELFGGDMTLPENFVETAPPFTGNPNNPGRNRPNPLSVRVNPQTTLLCTMLEITDPNAKRLGKTSEQLLEESNIGLVTEGGDDDDDDEPDDGVESDGEMNESSNNVTFNPSFIDSSLDLSQSSSTSFSSNISASWDNLMPGDQRRGGNATPSSTVKNVDVADDDEELQSILLAQKSKSLPPTPHHPSSNTDTSPRGSPPVSSSLLLSSTPLHRSFTDPVQSSSSSLLLSPADSGHSTSSQSENASSSVSRSRKLSVADRLRALNAKETECKNDEKEADSTSSDTNTTPSLSRLASVDSSHTPSPRPNLSKSDTLDCQGTQTRTELEALCASSSGVSSTTLGERLSPPLKRDSSGLSTDTVESGGEGSQVTSSSPLLSSSSSSSLPSPSVAGGGSVKKFKRRNVSMYQEESQE